MNMKLFFLAIAVFFTTAASAQNKSLTDLLNSYYKLKNELIAGKSANATAAAAEFKTVITSADTKTFSAAELKAFNSLKQKLEADASAIAATKDINKQRELFAALSNNMITLAKATTLSDKEIYVDYCPMKKVWWLSDEKAIKNPYYGNTMLTCGNIKETIKQ